MLTSKRVCLIVTGGISAYKAPDLVRLLVQSGAEVQCVLTNSGAQFVTPLTLQSLSGHPVHTQLFSLAAKENMDHHEGMDHIELSRQADVILIAPATANTLAKMAHGIADDLASTVLLACNKPILVAPAMNVEMWENAATQDNISTLQARNVTIIGPDKGELACGEWGQGRMSEPSQIIQALLDFFAPKRPLAGQHAIVTSGPTHEAIDPVRFITNRSSGKQGHAIAIALRDLGCSVTLISGPVDLPSPKGMTVVDVESASDMLKAVQSALPADIAVCAAAVADWRVLVPAQQKLKKDDQINEAKLQLVKNSDILEILSIPGPQRPSLVVGFAAETENVVANARQKLVRKGCDWIMANDVSAPTQTFGGDFNTVHLLTESALEDWPSQSKTAVAQQLAACIRDYFAISPDQIENLEA